MVGRPSLGTAARTVPVSVKLSPAERDYLARRYGSAGKGLRAAVECLLPDRGPIARATDRGTSQVLHEEPTLLPDDCTHPGWTTRPPAKGDTTLAQTCRTCGYVKTFRRPS